MKLKRILATVLALALLFSVAPIASAAWEDAPELALEKSVDGTTLTITLKTTEATELSALDFVLTYPTDTMTLKSTKNNIIRTSGFYLAPDPEDPGETLQISATVNIASAGEVSFALANEENVSFAADATLAVVNFTIVDSPKSSTFTFSSLSAGSAGLGSYNYSGAEIPSVTYAPPHDHVYTTYVYNNDATCSFNGTETATCDYCDETDTHDVATDTYRPAHTSDGNNNCATASYCTVCHAELRAAGEHTWDEGVEQTPPTCEAKGSALFTCTVCGTTETRDVDPLGHIWTESSTTAATCTTQGYTHFVCSRDGSHTKDDNFVEALGHNFVNYVADGNATCKTDGTKTATCERDGCEVTDTITDVGSHLNVAHTSDGNTDCSKATYCSVCGFEMKPAGEHSWNEGEVTVEPGIAAGEMTYTCTVCHETRKETIDPIIFTGSCGDDATWTVNTQTGTLTISGTGTMENYGAKTDVPWYGYRESITTVVVEDGITAIGNRAFFDCANLTNVTIPASVTVLGDAVFYNCSSLTGVELPADLTSIGEAAFRNCTALAAIEIPAKVTTIGQQAFYNCTSLTSIEIPNGVETIEQWTHQNDTSLTEVTIPASVTSIGKQAFHNCPALKDVYYAGTQEDWDKITIGTNNEGLSNATIHCHEHSFTYTVDGTTMKQTCTCGNEATATISASDATYDGKAHEATVAYSENWLADETVAVEYSANGNVNAGAVTATLVAGTGDGKKEIPVNYTIAKAPMDVTVATKTLLSKNVLGENVPKIYTIDLSELIPADAGNPVFTWADGNETLYGMAEIGGTVLTYTVTTPQDAKVTTSLKVKVTSNNYNDVDTLVIPFEFKDKIDVSDKLSLYKVEDVVVGGGQYDFFVLEPVVLYNGEITEEIKNATTIVYTDAFGKQYTELTEKTPVGTYTFVATYEDEIAEGEIPGHIGTISGELEITKGWPQLGIFGSPDKEYDGAAATITEDNGDEIIEGCEYYYSAESVPVITWYAVDGEGAKTKLDAAPVDVGTYNVEVSLAESANYQAAAIDVDFEITPKPVTITVNDATKEYGTEDPAFTGTVEGLVNDADLGTVSYHRTEADAGKENYGTVELTATYTENANYVVEVVNGKMTITKTQPTTAQLAGYETVKKTYDNVAVTATVEAAEGVEGLGTITVKYRLGDAAATTKAPVDAGEYTVIASIAEGKNYAAKDVEIGTIIKIYKANREIGELTAIELYPTKLTETLVPTYADLDKSAGVKYQSNNTAAVTVNNNGVVTAIANGEAVITVTLEETANYNAATKTVNVWACTEPVFGVKLAEATDGTNTTALSATLDGNKIVLSGSKSAAQTDYNVTLDIEKGFVQAAAEGGKIQVLYGETVVAEFEIDDSAVAVLAADVEIKEVESQKWYGADPDANTAADATTVEGLQDAATKELADDADAAKENAPEGTEKIKAELRMEITALKADLTADKPLLKLGMEPMSRLVAVKEGDAEVPMSEWQQIKKLATPVMVQIGVPIGFEPTVALADHDGDEKADEAIPVEMKLVDVGLPTEAHYAVFPATEFSTYTLIADDEEAQITFAMNDGSEVTKTYVAADAYAGTALPTDTKSGYRFSGWQFAGVDGTFTAMSEELMAALGATATAEAVWTPVSGGGSASTSANAIKTAETMNGTISANANNKVAGATVTINAKPDAGYKVASVKVTTASGKDVAVTEQNGVYTFTMPDEDVTVSAEFTEAEATQIFEDVATNAYYAKAVEWAVEKGITTGTSATTFSPNASCTRAQMVTFLWRAAGAPETEVSTAFTDVKADAYYAQAVAWALDNGITNGKGKGLFDPEGTVTRAESITMLFRYAKATAGTNVRSVFTDVNAYAYYFNAVDWAVNNGITNGTSATTFSPNADCVRAQIVTFLFRLLGDK